MLMKSTPMTVEDNHPNNEEATYHCLDRLAQAGEKTNGPEDCKDVQYLSGLLPQMSGSLKWGARGAIPVSCFLFPVS